MLSNNTTIAAIITPYGEGAVSIIRISGQDAFNIVNKVFSRDILSFKPNTINYGKIIDPVSKDMIDEVLVSVFKGPKSFTAEDTIEINTHGGIYLTNKILELLLESGASLAEPGDFTKRAFLNGRIDLTEADSIMDMITASNDNAVRFASNGLSGNTKKLINSLREDLLNIIAVIEVNIDYPEYDDVEDMTNNTLIPNIKSLIDKIERVIASSKITKTYTNGINTAIVGRPNAGKSSLLNMLLNENRALVTEIAGTTRDTIEASINIAGTTLNLIDTAGIRESDDLVESLGIEKSYETINKSELIIHVIDGSKPLEKEDLELIELTKDLQTIRLLNKSDLSKDTNIALDDSIDFSTVSFNGIDELENKIKNLYSLDNTFKHKDATYVSNARHYELLVKTLYFLNDSYQSAVDYMPVDAIELDLKSAFETLGEIIGKTSTNDLLSELFSKFCLGK